MKRFLFVGLILISTLGISMAVIFERPHPLSAHGRVYSVEQVETLLRHGPGALAGETIRVRALLLMGCPQMQGGINIWYTCDLIPASLASRLHARTGGSVTLPSPLELWVAPPSPVARFIHNLPFVGGMVHLQMMHNDFDPKIYRIILVPSATCNTGGLAACPQAEYAGVEG